MTTTTIDYTNVDDTKNGADYQNALKLEFQHAQSDMVLKPNVASAETITGAWEFTATLNLNNAIVSGDTDGLIVKCESLTGADQTLEIQGARNGATGYTASNLLFSNYDFDDTNSFDLVKIGVGMENAATHTGQLAFFTSDGATLVEALTISHDQITTASKLNATTFGLNKAPVGIHATAVENTTSMTLGDTQTEINKIIDALVALGFMAEV